MPPPASHPVSTDLSDQEVQARLTAAWVGIWMSVIVCLGAEVYALATWNNGANRELLLLITTIGLVTSPIIASLPLERMIRSRYRELFFVIWTTADIALIAASAALDGGTQSPFVLVLVLPFLYGALSYPLWATAVAGVVSLTAFVLIAISAGDDFGYSAFGAFGLLCVAILGSWESRNQSNRRRQLTNSAKALARSEEASRLGAEQQREVARFGQRALEGVGIGDLESEVVEIVRRTLDADIVALIRPVRDARRARGRGPARVPRGGEHDRKPPLRHRLPARLHARHGRACDRHRLAHRDEVQAVAGAPGARDHERRQRGDSRRR